MHNIALLALLLLIAGVGLMCAAFAWGIWMHGHEEKSRNIEREDAP